MTAHEALKKYFGYDNFRPLQEEIVQSILDGHDTLALMPTGGGKSLCFQVPTLAVEGLCLVITPLIALMKDQVENLRKRDIRAVAIYTGMSYDQQKAALDNCQWGPYRFLYVSPERLESEEFRERLARLPITLIAVDEAHCISLWGYDFRPSYLKIAEIRNLIKSTPRPLEDRESEKEDQSTSLTNVKVRASVIPILALTATATPEVVDDIQERLHFAHKNVLRKSFARDNLSYVVRNTNKKMDEIIHILNRVPGSAIVYVRNRKRAHELSDSLQQANISSDFYHAGLTAQERSEKQNNWKTGQTRVIVATNAFGMGIDKPDVRIVIHHDLPDSIEAYFQEAGRAGRDEKPAFAVLLYDTIDRTKMRKRLADNYPPTEFIEDVYHKTCDFLSVGAGSGVGNTFFLDINELCRVMHLAILPTYASLHILSQCGYFHFQEAQEIQPRVMIRIQRREFDDYNLSHTQTLLLELLMRQYTGIFTDLQYVHHFDTLRQRLQAMANVSQSDIDIHSVLVSLAQKHIITYISRTVTPTLTFTQDRQWDIFVPDRVYSQRKSLYEKQIQAMLEYAENQLYCRSQILLSYFGEDDAPACGTCDICRQKAKNAN